MNSLTARLIKKALRLQRPLLRQVSHPGQIAPLQILLEKIAVLPARSRAERITVAGIPALKIHNQRSDRRRGTLLVYIHGGGFNLGSPDSHRAFAARLMQAGQFAAVYMPRYRLAPRHPWPAGLQDVTAVWKALQQQHPDARICLAGESAGANLCLALTLTLRDQRARLPQRVYLHSPWLDVSLSGDSYRNLALEDGFIGTHPRRREWLELVFSRHYAAQHDPRHPHISPLFADLTGLPPLYLQTGAKEIFLADSHTLQARCSNAGVACELEVWPGLWHGFALFAPLLPEANQAIARAGRWLGETDQSAAPTRTRLSSHR